MYAGRRGTATRYVQQNTGTDRQTDGYQGSLLGTKRHPGRLWGNTWGWGLRISRVEGPGLKNECALDTGRQAGFQVKLPRQDLAPGLEVGFAQKWVGKLVSSPLLILEMGTN